MTLLPAVRVAMTPRRAAGRAEGLVKTLGSVCGAAAATLPPREAWENEPGVPGEDSACTVTVPPPRTVTSPFTWTTAFRRHRCPWIGRPAAQTQSTGAPAVASEGARTAGTLREGAAATVDVAPHVLNAGTIVCGARTCPSSLLSHLATAQWT